MMLLESPEGDRVLVESAEGYDGWAVIANPVEPPPPHCFWCEQAQGWKVDEQLAGRAELLATVRNPERLAGLLADILARLPSLPE